jgi:hypothetical protein
MRIPTKQGWKSQAQWQQQLNQPPSHHVMKNIPLRFVAALVLTLALAPALQAGTYYSTIVSNDGPLLYWNFDEAAGNAIQQMPLSGSSVNANNDLVPSANATRVSHASIAGGLPKLGNAANFNGTATSYFYKTGLVLTKSSLTAAYAMEFWMQPTNLTAASEYLINFGNNGPAVIYKFNGNYLELYAGTSGRTGTSGATVADTSWHHVMLLWYNGLASQVDAYVDGVLISTNRGSFALGSLTTTTVEIGAATTGGANSFQGRLDEVALYDLSSYATAVTVSNKVSLMASNHNYEARNTTGNTYASVVLADQPLLYWNFDEPSDNALQVRGAINNSNNDLVAQYNAGRTNHTSLGSGLQLGNTTDLFNTNYYKATILDCGSNTIPAPWAMEYWMQVQGPNNIGSADRNDYLVNFGSSSANNLPAIIYDFNAEKLELFGGGRTGTLGPSIADSAWHHVLWVFYGDGSVGVSNRADAYVDGVLYPNVRNDFSKAITLNNRLLFGAAVESSTASSDNAFQGRLDEFAIYNFGGMTEAAIRTKVSGMASNHFNAAFGDPGNISITVTQQPVSVTNTLYTTATFTVGAVVSNAPPVPLLYQWLKNGIAIANATNASFTTPPLPLSDIGTNYHSCRLQVQGKIVYSDAAALVVFAPTEQHTYYSTVVSNDGPILYWSFDEYAGNALQRISVAPLDNSQNDLAAVGGATRVEHSAVGSGLLLGNAADLSGANYYLANTLTCASNALPAPYGVEFWMQVQGANTIGTGDRQNYLANFGASGGNRPAIIYDFAAPNGAPDKVELLDSAGRTQLLGPLVTNTSWHHLLWVFYGDGTVGVSNRMDVYVDGSLLANVRNNYGGDFIVNNRLIFGAALPSGVNGFQGRLDEFAIYNFGGMTEAAIRAKVENMAVNHYFAALYGDPAAISITVTQQPGSVTNTLYTSATFTAGAEVVGAPAAFLAYQWLKNGALIGDATNSSYTTPSLQLGDIGTNYYSCRFQVLGKVVYSEAAALVVPLPATTPSRYSQEVLNDQPYLYWPFDEYVGTAQQVAPLGTPAVTTENDLVPYNGATRVSHTDIGGLPKLGNAADFNGANFFYQTGLVLSKRTLMGAYAIEFWMQAQGANTIGVGDRQDYLLNFGFWPNYDNCPAVIYDYNPDNLELFGRGNGGGRFGTNGPTITDNPWHHVLLAYYGNGSDGVAAHAEAYVDGIELGGNVLGNFSQRLTTTTVRVGMATPTANGFEGRLDEVAVYDLSGLADEATVAGKVGDMAFIHYLEGTTPDTGNTYKDVVLADGPLLYWNFDEPSGNALQLAPIQPLDNTQNELAPANSAGRVEHAATGSSLLLGNAVDLDGAGAFQRTGGLAVPKSSLPGPWAVEFWFELKGTQTSRYLMNMGTGGNSPAIIFGYNDQRLEVFGGSLGRSGTNGGPEILDTTWHHLLIVNYNTAPGSTTPTETNRVDFWIDGVQYINTGGGFNTPIDFTDWLVFGRAGATDNNGAFNGRLDELALYDLSGLASMDAVTARAASMVTRHRALSASLAPAFYQQPQSSTNLLGSDLTLTAAAVSLTSVGYQWYQGTSLLTNETGPSLVLNNLQLSNSGSYYVVASNTVGTVTSDVAVVTINRPPVASNTTAQVVQNQVLLLDTAKLLAGCSDPDGDPLTISGVSATSSNGGVVLLTLTNTIAYTPATDYLGLDQFSYTVSDGRGGASVGLITVNVASSNAPSVNIVSPPCILPNGHFHVGFAGIPGFTYTVQQATNVTGPWFYFTNLTAGVNGLFDLEDPTEPPPPVRYYRTTYP